MTYPIASLWKSIKLCWKWFVNNSQTLQKTHHQQNISFLVPFGWFLRGFLLRSAFVNATILHPPTLHTLFLFAHVFPDTEPLSLAKHSAIIIVCISSLPPPFPFPRVPPREHEILNGSPPVIPHVSLGKVRFTFLVSAAVSSLHSPSPSELWADKYTIQYHQRTCMNAPCQAVFSFSAAICYFQGPACPTPFPPLRSCSVEHPSSCHWEREPLAAKSTLNSQGLARKEADWPKWESGIAQFWGASKGERERKKARKREGERPFTFGRWEDFRNKKRCAHLSGPSMEQRHLEHFWGWMCRSPWLMYKQNPRYRWEASNRGCLGHQALLTSQHSSLQGFWSSSAFAAAAAASEPGISCLLFKPFKPPPPRPEHIKMNCCPFP